MAAMAPVTAPIPAPFKNPVSVVWPLIAPINIPTTAPPTDPSKAYIFLIMGIFRYRLLLKIKNLLLKIL